MEDARRQLRLLLWKNYLLRVRQPVILALELFWPIIIFITIMGARWTIPPVERPTCHYNAWALPSAGAVPFLQSLICNIDNDCLNETQFRDVPSYPNSRIGELVDHISPLLSDKKLRNFVEILPRGTKLARTLLDTLSQHDLRQIITKGIGIRSLLKQDVETKDFFLLYFPAKLAEDLFDSYIRLPQLLQLTSATSSLCSPDDVKPELAFPGVWSQVVDHFCHLSSSKQGEFFRDIQGHLDVSNIVLMVGNVMSQLGRVDVGETISRIGTTIQSLSAKYVFPSLFSGNMQPLLNDISTILTELQAGHLDLNLLSLVADDAAPVYENNNWSLLKLIVDQIKRLNTKTDSATSESILSSKDSMLRIPNSLNMQTSGPNVTSQRSNGLSIPDRKQNVSFSFLQTFGDWAETAMYILRLLPEEQASQITSHKVFAMFRFILDTTYKIIKTSSQRDFQDFFDLAETLFFTLADLEKSSKTFEPEFWTETLCNKSQFLVYLNIPETVDPSSLQEFSCNLSSTVAETIQRWPLQQNTKAKSTKDDTSGIVEMVDFLVNYKSPDLVQNSKSGIVRAKLLRLQMSFSNFVQHLSDKTNLTDSLTMLLRVTYSAFPKTTWITDFIPGFVNFLHKLSDSVISTSEENSYVQEGAFFIRGLVKSASEVAEAAIWRSIDESTLQKIKQQRDEDCDAATNENVTNSNCNTLLLLSFPDKNMLKKSSRKLNIDWNMVKADLHNLQVVLRRAFPSRNVSLFDKALIPPVISTINAGISSLHLFLPKPDCPVLSLVPRTFDSILCSVLRLQLVQKSLNDTSPLLTSVLSSTKQNNSVVIWKALSMFVRQILDLTGDLQDNRDDISSTIDSLVFSAQNASGEVDWENHVKLIFSVVHLVGSRLETEYKDVRKFFHTAQSLVNLFTNRLQVIESSSSEDSNVIRVEDVFPDAPVTQALVKGLFPRLPEVLSTLFWTSLAQGKMHHLASESQRNLTIVTKLLCNDTITDYLYNPSFEGKSQWDSLMREVCSHTYFKVFEEVLEDADIQTLIFENDNEDDPIEWKELQQGILELTSLTVKLSRQRQVDFSVFPPSHLWDELWANISSTAQKPSVVIYVLANSIFYPYCNPETLEKGKIFLFKSSVSLPRPLRISNVSQLSSSLCYMSTEAFVNTFVQTWSKPYNHSDLTICKDDWQTLYNNFMNTTNLRPVLQGILGDEGYPMFQKLDMLLSSSWNFSDISSFWRGLVEAAENVYTIVDLAMEDNLTANVANTSIPYIFEDFNKHVENVAELYVEDILKNKTLLKSFFSYPSVETIQQRKVQKWLNVQSAFFNGFDRYQHLAALCGNATFPMEADDGAQDILNLICKSQPLDWVSATPKLHGIKSDRVFQVLDEFLGGLPLSVDEKRKAYSKLEMSNWVKSTLHTSIAALKRIKVHTTDWMIFKRPRTFFNLFRSVIQIWEATLGENSRRNESCPPSSWSMNWSTLPSKLMNSLHDAEVLLCQLPLKNISSAYRDLSQILDVKNLVKEYFKVSTSKWSLECPDYPVPWNNISLTWLFDSVDLAERVFKDKETNLSYWKNVQLCSKNITTSMLFSDIARWGNVTKRIARLASSLSNSSSKSGDWNNIENKISSFISQQLPGFSTLSSFLNLTLPTSSSNSRKNSSLEYVLKVLEKSAFNLNWLSQRNFSTDSIKAAVCNRDNSRTRQPLDGILRLPPHQEAIEEVFHFLCNANGFEYLFSRINIDVVDRTLKEGQDREFRNGRWFRELFATSSGILDDVSQLVQASQHISIQTPTSSKDLIDIIVKLSQTTAIQDIFDGLNGIIEKLRNVFRGSSLLHYLQEILNGAQAFQSVQKLKLFKLNVQIQELLPKGANLEKYSTFLRERYYLNTQQVDEFMASDLDMLQLVHLHEGDKSGRRCSSKDLYHGTDHNGSLPSIDYPAILCDMLAEHEINITADHLKDLIFGKLLKNAGELGLQGVLGKANLNFPEAKEMLELLQNSTDVIPDLELRLEKLLSVLGPSMKEQLANLNITRLGIASFASPEALAASGSILCGKPLKTLYRKFSLLSVGDNPEPKVDMAEVESLPNEFCQNAYKQMLKLPGGPILWGFLKPVFRGKILYTPNHSYAATAIIQQLNATFSVVTDYIQLLQAVAVGTTGLHYLEHKKDLLQSIQALMSSKQLSKIVGMDSDLISGILGAGDWSKTWSGDERFGSAILEAVTLVGNVSQCITLNRFVGFETESELEKAAMMLHAERKFIAAIVFLENNNASLMGRPPMSLPHHIQYKIRMDIDNVPTAKEIRRRWWHPYPYDNFFDDFRYFRGFIQLQELIDSAIYKLQTSSSSVSGSMPKMPFKKYLQQFPYPCHQQDKFGGVLKGSLSGVMTVSWIFLIAFFVRDKVLEKELSLQAILSVMGLNPVIAWLSWFLTGLATISVSVCGIVIIMKWGGITPMTDPTILFIFILLYALLLISFCHLMSVLFERASTAALMAIIFYMLSFFPFLLFVTWEFYFVFWQKLLTCSLVATSFCFGTLYLTRLEEQGTGIQWDNVWQSPIPDDSMSMAMALIAMSVCTVGYFGLAMLISQLKKGKSLTSKIPWHLLVAPSQLNHSAVTKKTKCSDDILSGVPAEKAGSLGKETVSIRDLRVIYQGRKPNEEKEAVCGLSLGLHNDQITTLLGHNGAGKTTTIKVLTGRLRPNSGDISIYGIPIPDASSRACKLVGYCPQYNTLFSKLTVKEHLYLFAQLKGVLSGPQLDDDVNEMLNCLGLQEKQHEWTENLSGGQRRRLCVGMAFVGGSKFIVLDEPTSSVDPLARRSIWDLIVQYRKGRTILLTTHHLDEADILSDHIVVLHKGKVLCQGSPLFLKSRFGSGHKLSLFASSDANENGDGEDSGNASSLGSAEEEPKENDLTMDTDGLLEFIQGFIPYANLLENDGTHVVISLPSMTHSKSPTQIHMSQLFQELDLCLETFGFKSYSLTSTTLEEVFLTLCRVEDAKRQFYKPDIENSCLPVNVYGSRRKQDCPCQNRQINRNSDEVTNLNKWRSNTRNSISSDNDAELPIHTLTGSRLIYSQFKGLIQKRLWHTRRNWKIVICSIIMPCLFIALAMGLSVGRPARRVEPKVLLTPQLYKSQKTGYTVSFISSDQWNSQPSKTVLDLLVHDRENPNQQICRDYEAGSTCNVDLTFDDSKDWCLCKNQDQCLAADTALLPITVNSGKNVFYNLTGVNLPRHLLSNYIKFNEKRYGGWTVMHKNSKTVWDNSSLPAVAPIKDAPVIKVWFDNSGYHAAPSYLNAIHNAILQATMKSPPHNETGKEYGITAYSHPMQISAEQLSQETLLQRLGEIGIAFVFLVGLSLVPAASSVYLVREASLEEKRVQITSGIHPVLYWMTHLAWDIVSLLLMTTLASLVIYSFNLSAFVSRLNLSAVVCLIFCFGWASITMMYIATRLFKEGSLAFMVLFTSNTFIGLVIMLVVLSLHMLNIASDVEQILNFVKRIALIFPQWNLLGGLTSLAQNQLQSDIFQIFGQDTYGNPFGWDLLLPNYITLFVEGLLFFIINIAIETRLLPSFLRRIRGQSSTTLLPHEPKKSRQQQEGLIRLQDVSKVYQSRMGFNRAVDNVSLGIYRGECFGLIGANGAGKTTLFRMLSGQIAPTNGAIHIGENMRSQKSGFLGYCPQADALDELLTPREHLILYAKFKGIHPISIKQVIEDAMNSFDLIGHADCAVKALSGGTKRKLCTAIAMMGCPSVVLLDEPTSGMDPATRRLVWTSIMNVTTQKQKAAVILSSHSIEECDILCSRIGIMVNGQIRCLGTPQELKTMYGDGIQISLRTSGTDNSNKDYSLVLDFIRTKFPTAQIKGHHCSTVEFSISNREASLSKVFEHLEEGMHTLGLQDIALNHTTLDQVFVGFVQQQSDGTEQRTSPSSIEDGSEQAFSMKSFPNSIYSSDQDVSWTENNETEYCTRL